MNDQEKDELVGKLSAVVLGAVPKAHAVNKYGGTLYTLKPDEKEAQFCGIFLYNNYVQLAFSQGALLKDPEQLLEGKGKFRRHFNLNNIQDVNKTTLAPLLKEAAKISMMD